MSPTTLRQTEVSGQQNGKEPPTTPQTARKRGFSFFKRVQSPSAEVTDAGSPTRPSPLAYQARIKSFAGRRASKEQHSHHHLALLGNTEQSPLSTPNASTSNLADGHNREQTNRKSTPSRIHIDKSSRQVSNGSIASPHEAIARQDTSASAKSDESTPRAICPLNQKRRQPSLVLEGMLKGHERRQSSWSSDQGRLSRQGPRRSVSSPLETPTLPIHKEQQQQQQQQQPIAGSKPVAPSFHPDAPDELKVKPPSHPVLLPFLSIPGVSNNEEEENTPPNHLSPTSPADFNAESVLRSAKIKHQRPGIKVRIITWNQGNSVPKGNLEALLGRVGEYIAPQEGWDESSDEEEEGEDGRRKSKHKGMGVAGQEGIPRNERIPPLPHDDAHPYHVVVVAGQECPWGDGKRIATGVMLAGELGDLGRSKSRAAQHLKDKNKEASKSGKVPKEGEEKLALEDKIASSAIEGEFPFSEVHNKSVPSTPLISVPPTPGGAPAGMGAWGIGGKGWSDMCEDWLCRGPLAQATATKGLAQASKSMHPSPHLTPLITPEDGMSPTTSRAATPNALHVNRSESLPSLTIPPPQSAALTASAAAVPAPALVEGEKVLTPSLSSSVISQDHFYNSPYKNPSLAVPRPRSIARRFSLANRSREVIESPTVKEDSHEGDETDFLSTSPNARPLSPIKQSIDANIRLPAQQNKHIPGKPHHRLGLHIPGLSAAHHVTVQSDGTPLSLGAYELVAKERCYMMYMAVYVWRGCLDRVAKTSQGHVKSGLLAGRVGNKGCVGISLKLGSSRLLFVNAHLAAHEGRIAERIANVEKIKKELKVDTFLPPEDPRNQADDVTEAFDYAFWMGDLNFRVDISRQHADWLLMKKQYQDALAFDQLTKVMKEQPTVFNRFIEAPITFPPTFKYDVLKTIKQKNEEKMKKVKAASNLSKAVDADGHSIETSRSSVLPSSGVFAGPGGPSTKIKDDGADAGNEPGLLRESKREDVDDDGSSFTSSAWGSSAHSTSAGNNYDQEGRRGSLTTSTSKDGDLSFASQSTALDPVVSSNTAAAEGHKIHGKVIKAKKRFFDVVHAIGSHSQRKEEEYVPEVVKAGRQMKADALKKRASVGSASKLDQAANGGSSDGYEVGELIPPSASFGGHVRSESYTNLDDVRPIVQIPIIRRRSSTGDVSEGSPTTAYSSSLNQPSCNISAMTEEYERQPYDTSAKQRVPSWCDRVLWKSNVQVVEDEGGTKAQNETGSHGLSTRMGHAISNAIHSNRRHHHHLTRHKTEGGPSVTFATLRPSQIQARSVASPGKNLPSPPAEPPSPPRRGWFARRNSGQHMKRASTMDVSDLAATKVAERSRSATDLPSLLSRSQSARSIDNGRFKPRQRKSSLEVPRQRVASPNGHDGIEDTPVEASSGQGHRRNSSRHRMGTLSYESSHLPPAIKSAPPASDNANRRSTWWNDLLPNFLHPQSALSALSNLTPRNDEDGSQAQGEAEQEELIGPRRGQIECMSYRSLTDAEMRMLDARSDHYGVVWVGNIGI